MVVIPLCLILLTGMTECTRQNTATSHRLPEVNLETLQNSTLSTSNLISYLRARSLQDSEWEDVIGRHFMEFSPVFVKGLAGVLFIEFYEPHGDTNVNPNFVTPAVPHRTFVWTSEKTPSPKYLHDSKGNLVKSGHFYFDQFHLVFAGDSIIQEGLKLPVRTNSSRNLFDTLVQRLRGQSVQTNSVILNDGFVMLDSDSVVSMDFYTHSRH